MCIYTYTLLNTIQWIYRTIMIVTITIIITIKLTRVDAKAEVAAAVAAAVEAAGRQQHLTRISIS